VSERLRQATRPRASMPGWDSDSPGRLTRTSPRTDRRGVDAVLLHLEVQLRAPDAELPRRLRTVAACSFQRAHDQTFLQCRYCLVQRHRLVVRLGRVTLALVADRFGQVGHIDHLAASARRRALERVCDQERDVAPPGAQRRHVDLDHRQAIVEVVSHHRARRDRHPRGRTRRSAGGGTPPTYRRQTRWRSATAPSRGGEEKAWRVLVAAWDRQVMGRCRLVSTEARARALIR